MCKTPWIWFTHNSWPRSMPKRATYCRRAVKLRRCRKRADSDVRSRFLSETYKKCVWRKEFYDYVKQWDSPSQLNVLQRRLWKMKCNFIGPVGLVQLFLSPAMIEAIRKWLESQLQRRGDMVSLSTKNMCGYLSMEIATSLFDIGALNDMWSKKMSVRQLELGAVMGKIDFWGSAPAFAFILSTTMK